MPFDLDRLAERHGLPSERFSPLLREAAAAGLLARLAPFSGSTWRPTLEGLRRADGLALCLSEAAARQEIPAQTP